MPAPHASSAQRRNPLATWQSVTSWVGLAMRRIMRAKATSRCTGRHRHGEETPGPRLQMVMLDRQHGGTISTRSSQGLLHQGGLWVPHQGQFAVIRLLSGFAVHVLNDEYRAENPTQAQAKHSACHKSEKTARASPSQDCQLRQLRALCEPLVK
jgi:hypothetical protein